MLRYMTIANRDVDELLRELDTIANLTQGADETIQYMKDSVTAAQKSSPSGKMKRKRTHFGYTAPQTSPRQNSLQPLLLLIIRCSPV